MSESSVAPVVVNPLIASKVESRRLWKVPSIRNGTPPRRAASGTAPRRGGQPESRKVTER
jgi:hypothetical protein